MERRIETAHFATFRQWLLEEEREPATIEKYLREVELFATWMESQPVTKEQVARWKAHLTSSGYQPGTVNGKLSALNKFFSFLGWSDCRIKYLRIQRRVFRNIDRELTKEEYHHLLETAQEMGRERLALLIETICATGIRVSEVKYITVESVCDGRVEISLKGKIRTILLPGKLCRKLRKYAK